MPPQPPTRSLPKVDAVQLAIANLTTLVEDRFHEISATIGMVSNDLSLVKQRVSIIESLRHEDESRLAKASGGVRGLSVSDESQTLAIASIASKVDTLTKDHAALLASQSVQTEMLIKMQKFLATPVVKIAGGVLFGIISSYVASKFGVELPK